MSEYRFLIPPLGMALWIIMAYFLWGRTRRSQKADIDGLRDDFQRLRGQFAQPTTPAQPPRSKPVRVHRQPISQAASTGPIRNPFNPNAYPHRSPQAADPLPDPMLLTAVDRPGWEPPGAWSQPTEQATAEPTPEPFTACDVATSYDPGPASDGSLY